MIRVTLDGQDALRERLREIPEIIQGKVLRDMAQIVYDTAQRGADAHTKTGAMARSLYMRKITGGREIGHDLQHAPHALFVHWGTRPHVIERKQKKALRWANDGKSYPSSARGDFFIFAKRVNHPGYEGDPWLRRAAREAVAKFDNIVSKHLKGL